MARNNFIDWNGSGNLDSQDLVTGVGMDTLGAKGRSFSEEETDFILRQMDEHVGKYVGYIHTEMHKFDLKRTRYGSKREFLSELLLDVAKLKHDDDEAGQIVHEVMKSYDEEFERPQ